MNSKEWQQRLGFVFTVNVLVFVSVVSGLYQKSVIDHPQILGEAEKQYAYRKTTAGERGEVVVADSDKNYFPLATNEWRYQALVIPNRLADPSAAATALAPVLGLGRMDIFNKINNKKPYIPPLKRRLTLPEADQVAALRLDGVLLIPELVRYYPEQATAAHVLGFVNYDGNGSYGVEGAYDAIMKGASGYLVGEKDNQGRPISLGEEIKAKKGASLVLTIDRPIQEFVEKSLADAVKEFEADGGTAIVMQPSTGDIVALSNVPNFNPNTFNSVGTDQQGVFLNPAVSAVWEPGSIVKPLIMALAIEKKLFEPDTKGVFGASIQVLNHVIWTAEKKAFGEETMTQVLENSDNVAMVSVGDKLGNEAEYAGLKQFGFGNVPKLKLQGVISGVLPPVKNWNDLTRATLTFGQGMSATPLQMIMAYSALANKGVMMQPRLVSRIVDDKGDLAVTAPREVGRAVSEETSRKVIGMLESVVINGHGKRAAVPGYRIGGKTGTAQVANPAGGYFDDRHIGSFVGFFPASDPQYSVLVKLDNPKTVRFAESSAAPTFGKIAAWILHQKQIKPDKVQ